MARIEGPRPRAGKAKLARTGARPAGQGGQPARRDLIGQPPIVLADPSSVDPAILKDVASIATDDPQREHKVLRCFVEHVLRQGLGSHEDDGARFGSLVDETMARMGADAGLRHDLLQAVATLSEMSAGKDKARR
jgi:hypothetical protein